jgi:hypothetical protein
MPRQARLDAPGTLHHVIVGGIERSDIIDDDQDRDNFAGDQRRPSERNMSARP